MRSARLRKGILCAMAVFFPASEAAKQILMTVSGGSYQWWYFPFQLCAMPLYFLPVYCLAKDGKVKRTVASFLADFALIGGTFVFLDTSGMHYDIPILTFHSYLWHVLMIIMALLLAYGEDYDPTLAGFRREIPVFAAVILAAEALNTVFRKNVINMFFISPFLKMNTVIVKDVAKYTGDGVAIVLYVAAMLAGGGIVHRLHALIRRKTGIDR